MLAERATIPLKPKTRARLRRFKGSAATYDAAINDLLDSASAPLEVVTPREMRIIEQRLKSPKGRDWRDVKRELDAERA
ncbi:MAG: hypothetical protein ACYDCK_12630 [Thermoplasmatota archaeon]